MLGEINKNTKGTEMIIIAERNNTDIDVEFLDDYHFIKKHVARSNFLSGCVKNPFDKTVFNVGYVGYGKYQVKDGNVVTSAYAAWQTMLDRCYGDPKKYPAYNGIVYTSLEWHNYQNFAKWYEENKYDVGTERLHLDKDIKYPGNKLYSPFHCMLVPQRINMLFTNKPNNRGLPNGIYKDGNKYRAKYNNEELGSYKTIKEAYSIYAIRKKEIIVKTANEYKNIIPYELYEALLNYEVKIENDKNWTTA